MFNNYKSDKTFLERQNVVCEKCSLVVENLMHCDERLKLMLIICKAMADVTWFVLSPL